MSYKSIEDRRECSKKHYKNNKETYKKRARLFTKEAIKRNVEFISDYKIKKGCEICGYKEYDCALDFHHIDKDSKVKNVARMVYNGCSVETLKKEIDDCMVLCSNCHRVWHFKMGF